MLPRLIEGAKTSSGIPTYSIDHKDRRPTPNRNATPKRVSGGADITHQVDPKDCLRPPDARGKPPSPLAPH